LTRHKGTPSKNVYRRGVQGITQFAKKGAERQEIDRSREANGRVKRIPRSKISRAEDVSASVGGVQKHEQERR